MNEIISLIIDDERPNRELLRNLIPQLNNSFRIAGEAEGVEDGYEKIEKIRPLVVFLDIQMGDGTGFDLLRKFSKLSFEVVFVSGFDEYALKAFEYNALDYIMKPIDVNRFGETLNRIHYRVTHHVDYFENIVKALHTYDPKSAIITKVPVHHHDHVILLDLHEIMYVQAHEGCTYFYKTQTERYSSAKQLSDYDFILESLPEFLRINKGCYVNVNYITSYTKGFDCTVVMKDQSFHEVSRRKKTEILERLAKSKP